MTTSSLKITTQAGTASAAVIALIAIAAICGGVAYFYIDFDEPTPQNVATVAANTEAAPQKTDKTQVATPEPEVSIDADVFCDQVAEVGNIFGEELTGATVRNNVSFGPQVGCSWSGPYVLVYFGKGSYERRNTGFGSENLVTYQGTDLEAVKREKYAVHSGFEVEVKSDKGLAFRISQSTGRQTDLTPEQYNQIANIVNGVLSKHY